MEIILCQNCKNYLGDLKCQAFIKGIPNNILEDGEDHKTPLPEQDNTIVFEPIDDSFNN